MSSSVHARKTRMAISPRLATITLRKVTRLDRKSTRLNSSHVKTSYAVFCLKKKNTKARRETVQTARKHGQCHKPHHRRDKTVRAGERQKSVTATAPRSSRNRVRCRSLQRDG